MVHSQNLRRTDLERTTSVAGFNVGTFRSPSELSNELFSRRYKSVAVSATKRIALALQETVALRFSILQGVQDFARTRSDWNLVRSGGSLVISWNDALAARPDGIIGFVGEANIPALRKTGIPIVCVNSVHNLSFCVKVRSDAHAVGSLAAKYFLELGYQEFAFCTDVPLHCYSQLRWGGYRDVLQRAGFSAHQIRLRDLPSVKEGFEQLQTLPARCAVFCATDSCARSVLTYCEDCSIPVPQHLAVLGTDNDPFYCEGGRTLLSSIDVNHRKIGAQAASTISRILDGETAPIEAVLIPPAMVVTRSSTDPAISATHPLVAKALKQIEEHAHDPQFTTEQLAKICGASSRTIGRLFEQHRLRSPYQVLLNVRITSAQRLLQESELSADEIAFRCGFADYSSFYRAFKSQLGISPSAFRWLHNVGP
jgi:LacI family transcriptional regulator, galactose operon repressor